MREGNTQLPKEEGYLVEFKDFSGGISEKELSKTICAFANTEGGTLYLGVTDRRLIQGLKVTPGVLDQIQNAAREGVTPNVPIAIDTLPVAPRRSVLIVSVEKSGHLHSISSGQSYIRVGTQDKRVLGDELLRLAESKTQVSFEERALDAGTEVLDLEAIAEYYEARKAISAVGHRLDASQLLRKMGLAEEEGGRTRIRAGAHILFGKKDDSLLLQRDFVFVKYEAGGGMYSFRENLSLPVSRLLARLMELIRPHNRRAEGVEGLTRVERFDYPEEALREALLNAVAHRDYRIQGLSNECRYYPDRIEFISAGGLPSFMTLENLSKRHYSRNPKIMHALLVMGLVEELGQGITMMTEALKKNGNPPPEFSVDSDQFRVIFRKGKVKRTLGEMKSVLDANFVHEPFLSRRQIEGILGLGATSAKYLLRDLAEEGYLVAVGRGPATRYRKAHGSE